MSEQDTDSPKMSPGARLTAAREQAGWSLVQTADRLHLDVATVKALEAGHFEALGAVVYARGHLRRYAELLGLPADELEAAYTQANPPRRQPDLRRTTALQNGAARGVVLRPGTVAIGAVILVMAALVWWAMHVPHARRLGATAPAPASEAASQSAAPPAAADAGLGLKLGQGSWTTTDPSADANRLFDGSGAPAAGAAPAPPRSHAHPQRP
jgi:cytoskeleton protein RodZ